MEILKCTGGRHPPFPTKRLTNHRSLLARRIVIFPDLNCHNRRSILARRPHAIGNVDGEVDRADSMSDGRGEEEEEEELEIEHGDMLLETCVVRNLAPVLSVEDGLEKIKEEVEKLKLNPPSSPSGILRFQVAVPPSAKSFKWFCCQPESSGVFPQFFLSRDGYSKDSNFELFSNGTRGVFGIGAAFYCRNSSSSPSSVWNSFKRYLTSGSSLLISYGFMNLETDLCSAELKTGSFYLVVPQVELDERQSMSILAATLAWNDSSLCTLGDAILSLEKSLHQVF